MTREEILKVAKPILFNTEDVRAVLDGRKTVTRRAMKPQPIFDNGFWKVGGAGWSEGIKTFHPVYGHSLYNKMPYKPGDYLYVMETWERFQCINCDGDESGQCSNNPDSRDGCYVYRATHYINGDARWRPSIHMPKEAARIFLRVKDVYVERLQEIDNVGALKEGCDGRCSEPADGALSDCQMDYDFSIEKFMTVWDSTIKPKDRAKYGWDANPWVLVVEFEKAETIEYEKVDGKKNDKQDGATFAGLL